MTFVTHTHTRTQVERLQADVHRLQEELRRSKEAEEKALDRVETQSVALQQQRSGFEVRGA